MSSGTKTPKTFMSKDAQIRKLEKLLLAERRSHAATKAHRTRIKNELEQYYRIVPSNN